MHMDSAGGPGSPFGAEPANVPAAGVTSPDRCDAGESSIDRCGQVLPSQIASIVAENHELRAEVERLRADRAQMCDIQTRLMEAVGSKSADRLVHDVRNVLNERELYRALADTMQD